MLRFFAVLRLAMNADLYFEIGSRLVEESFNTHDRKESRNHYLKRGCRVLDGR